MYKLTQVSKLYKTKNGMLRALDSINLEIKNKGLYLIYGQSGSGKSTLLNLLAQYEKETEGTIERECSANEVGVVFQNSNLLENLTVKENLCIFGFSVNEIEEVLLRVNLSNKLNEKVKVLSGGEKQRLSIARALLKNIHVLLLDEPTGNLDETNSTTIFELLKELSKNLLVIVISHNYTLASKYANYEIHLIYGKIESIKENDQIDDIELFPLEQKNKSLSFLWQMKYGLKNLKSKFVINVISFVLIGLLLLLFMCVLNLITFDIEANIYQELKDRNLFLVHKKEYNPALYETRVFYKGSKLKKELNEISNHVYPYFSNQYVHLSFSNKIQPNIVIVPDSYEFSIPLQGTNGIVISDMLQEYYFGSQQALNKELNFLVKTEDFSCEINDSITGVLATGYSKEQYNMYLNDQWMDWQKCSIFITESIMKENFYKIKTISIGGSSFFTISMRDYVMNKNRFKVYSDDENLIAGRSIQNKYEVILNEHEYFLCFGDGEFKERDVFFKDIHSSPNVVFYQETPNLYDLSKTLKVVGVVDDKNISNFISEDFMQEILTASFDYVSSGYLINAKKENLKQWINKGLKNNLEIDDVLEVFTFNEQRKTIATQFFYVFIIVGILSVLFLLYSGYNQIKYKEKEIVVFKAFCISNWRIVSPFLLGEILKTMCALLITAPFVNSVVYKINKIFFASILGSFKPILISPLLFLYTILFCIFIVGLSILIPYLTISRKEIGIAFKEC